jgi:Putative phage abortive infection protein
MKKNSIVSVLTAVAFLLGVVGIAIPMVVYFTNIQYRTDNSYFGNFGDWFGGIAGPLLSFSSFLIVYVALRLQSQESNEQKAESLLQQSLAATKRFEESYFYLFSQINLTIDKLWTLYVSIENNSNAISYKDKVISFESEGRSYFSNILKQIDDKYCEYRQELIQEPEIEVIKKAYINIYNLEEDSLGLYFKQIQLLLMYVDNSNLIKEDEKRFYINILETNFTSIEKIILHYHVLFCDALNFTSIVNLVKKFRLTENLNENLLISNNNRFISKGWTTKDSIIQEKLKLEDNLIEQGSQSRK